jgi:hypothetical protein
VKPEDQGAKRAVTEHSSRYASPPEAGWQVELPLSFEELVATLYGPNLVAPDDLPASDGDLRDLIMAVIACEGSRSIQEQAKDVLEAEAAGVVTAPEWLARVRQRVSALLGSQP